MASTTFLQRVGPKNYKSIGACDVKLGPLTFLVGPNGSGKSNFLDALRFVTDALSTSLDHAIRDRGGIDEVRRRSGGHPNNFGVALEFRTPQICGQYTFEISARTNGAWTVKREECLAMPVGGRRVAFTTEDGQVKSVADDLGAPPAASADRLFLVNVSGMPAFRPVYDAFTRMGFYNLNPNAMRELQPSDPGHLLKRDGSNAASCLTQLESARPDLKQ